MDKGLYVRCPLIVEAADEQFPRCFMLAQIKKFNKLADTVEVIIHDLLGSKGFYPHVFAKTVFPVNEVERCPAISGGHFTSPFGNGHIITRIYDTDGEQPYCYYVQLENGRYLRLDETQMQIEYSQMDYPPLKQMLNYEFQHPSWYSNRIKVSRNVNIINNAAYGFNTLAGCRTFLLPHQISTISRCLEFTPIRYMLADEVGLGKTIEACGIVKIMISENKDLRILFIIPGALINQWKNELKYKFSLFVDDDSEMAVVPLEELQSCAELQQEWDIVVIDETHNLLRRSVEYQIVLELSKRTPNILLLSATPIQDREEEFLRLLSLLSPEQYESMPLSDFSLLVDKQKSIQRSVNQQIKRMNSFDQYGSTIVENLNVICNSLGDKALRRILDKVDSSDEVDRFDISEQALSYICENYRLERRVIRNRRELLSAKMAIRTLTELSYLPASADDFYNEVLAIESVVSFLSEKRDGSDEFIHQVAQPLLSALFSSPWALCAQLDRMDISDTFLRSCAKTWADQAEQEFADAAQLLDDPALIKGRLLKVLDYIEQNTDILEDEECKIVVFTGHNATLRIFSDVVGKRLKAQGISVVEFGAHMSREELEDSVYDFQNDINCRMIICDETGGEGRNFQNAEMILHLDMPWSINALEQRIGRLDRLGREQNRDVLSVVIYTENTIENQLLRIWKDGMKLFEHSLSGLEIITGELNKLITKALLDDFHNGLANAFDDILAATEEMRESVLDEQIFDVGATIYRPLSQAVSRVLASYKGEEDDLFASSMIGWGTQAGLNSEKPTKSGLIQFRESSFSARAAMQSLFIPPKWKDYNSFKIVKREHQLLGTFSRDLAIEREDILFFAPGDQIYDSIISNAIGCWRGRCCAIELNGSFNFSGFIFIYNIAPRLDALIANNQNVKILSQFRMFLPLEQLVVIVPLEDDSANVPEDRLKLLFTESWRIKRATHLGERGGSRMVSSPLERFIEGFPPDEWQSLVIHSERRAREKAKAMFLENADLATAKREIQRIINGYMAECTYFGKDEDVVEEKRTAYKLAYNALANSRRIIDSVCFLRVVNRSG